jgi:hypothetical protein
MGKYSYGSDQLPRRRLRQQFHRIGPLVALIGLSLSELNDHFARPGLAEIQMQPNRIFMPGQHAETGVSLFFHYE